MTRKLGRKNIVEVLDVGFVQFDEVEVVLGVDVLLGFLAGFVSRIAFQSPELDVDLAGGLQKLEQPVESAGLTDVG